MWEDRLTATAPAGGLTVPRSEDFCIAGFQRAGMLDWPGRVAATVFLSGCTLRCPYCHNPDLVTGTSHREAVTGLLAHVRERAGWLDGIVITGGEPTASPYLRRLIGMLRADGMPIKLDTNGTNPEVLESLLAERLVDFVALDVKAIPEHYQRATGMPGVWPGVDRSIDAVMASGVDHEFRTTCYPLAVGPDDIVHIAARLAGARRYVLQQFRPHTTFDAAAVGVRPHSKVTLVRVAERCSLFVPTVVRGA